MQNKSFLSRALCATVCGALAFGAFASLSSEVQAARQDRESAAEKNLRQSHWKAMRNVWSFLKEEPRTLKVNLPNDASYNLDKDNFPDGWDQLQNKQVQELQEQVQQERNIQVFDCAYRINRVQVQRVSNFSEEQKEKFQRLLAVLNEKAGESKEISEGFAILSEILYAQIYNEGLSPVCALEESGQTQEEQEAVNWNLQINARNLQVRNFMPQKALQFQQIAWNGNCNFNDLQVYGYSDPMQHFTGYAQNADVFVNTVRDLAAMLMNSALSQDDYAAAQENIAITVKDGLVKKILFSAGKMTNPTYGLMYLHDRKEGLAMVDAECARLEGVLDELSKNKELSKTLREEIRKSCKEAKSSLEELFAFGEALARS